MISTQWKESTEISYLMLPYQSFIDDINKQYRFLLMIFTQWAISISSLLLTFFHLLSQTQESHCIGKIFIYATFSMPPSRYTLQSVFRDSACCVCL